MEHLALKTKTLIGALSSTKTNLKKHLLEHLAQSISKFPKTQKAGDENPVTICEAILATQRLFFVFCEAIFATQRFYLPQN